VNDELVSEYSTSEPYIWRWYGENITLPANITIVRELWREHNLGTYMNCSLDIRGFAGNLGNETEYYYPCDWYEIRGIFVEGLDLNNTLSTGSPYKLKVVLFNETGIEHYDLYYAYDYDEAWRTAGKRIINYGSCMVLEFTLEPPELPSYLSFKLELSRGPLIEEKLVNGVHVITKLYDSFKVRLYCYRAIYVLPYAVAPMSVWGVVLGQAGGIPAVANATIEARFLNGTIINSTKTNEWGFYNLTIRGLEAGTAFRLIARYGSWVNDTVVLEFQPSASIRVDYTYTPSMIHTIKVELLKGWNLIGLSLKPENCTVESIFGENLTRISVIYGYENGSWLYWWTPMAGGLKELKPGMGYWVYAKSNFTLTLKGTIPPRPSLNPGWNLIALTGTTSASPEEYLEGYDWTVIYGYNAYTGGWLCYVKGMGGNLKALEPGLGYWVYVGG